MCIRDRAIAAEEESYERFSVIETENGYAVWDDIRDEIYVDDEGVSEAVSYTHLDVYKRQFSG